MIPVTYDNVRVSKTDRDDKNLQAQLHEPAQCGLRRDLVLVGDESSTTIERQGW